MIPYTLHPWIYPPETVGYYYWDWCGSRNYYFCTEISVINEAEKRNTHCRSEHSII